MSGGISRDEVFRVARLAHIDLTPAEAESLPAQLDRIVEYVKQLEAVGGAAPGGGPAGGEGAAFETPQTPLRADAPAPCLPTGEALAAAPARRGDLIAVPRVIGGEDAA